MAGIIHRPTTLADLENIPEKDGFRYELRNGEIIQVPPPKPRHWSIQQRLVDLLRRAAGSAGIVGAEFGFAIPQSNYRIVDVAFIAARRWDAADKDHDFPGAPDLAVEILSPSNSATEMRDKRKLCLENGSREFWIVDPEQREVEVSTPDGRSLTCKSGQQIALFFAPESPLAVDAIFET